ncbi:MAG: GHKL domain-containing protein [candidate division Zixibacteria bacterium]|nr:GHKL domain-containing protein [candidate division Zixibacteria bacterium]
MANAETKNSCGCWITDLLAGKEDVDLSTGKIFDYCKGCPDLEKLKERASGRRTADTTIAILIDKLFERIHSCRIQLVDTASSLRKKLEELSLLNKVTDHLLKTDNLERALALVLTGVTAGDAFGFNRAAIFLCDLRSNSLRGIAGIGCATIDEARKLWMQFDSGRPTFDEALERIYNSDEIFTDTFHHQVWQVQIPFEEEDNVLMKVLKTQEIFVLKPGEQIAHLCPQLDNLADPAGFVAVPIATDNLDFGVLIADNFVTNKPVSEDDILSLKTFANTAATAFENVGLHNQLRAKLEELKHTHDLLRENQSYLVQHERLADIGKLATTVTHEIKTPLITIGAYTRRLLNTFGTEKFNKEHLEVILHEVDRLEKISSEILDYSKEIRLEITSCDLCGIIKEILKILGEKLEDYKIGVKTKFHDRQVIIRADANRIRQVIYNLIQNAMDAMMLKGGTLTISTHTEQNYTVFEIEDTGEGIKQEAQEKLFTPFYSTKAKGSGLGLSVSKKIIDDHGGYIKAETERGKGSKFSVYLPGLKSENQPSEPKVMRSQNE